MLVFLKESNSRTPWTTLSVSAVLNNYEIYAVGVADFIVGQTLLTNGSCRVHLFTMTVVGL